MGGGTFNGSGEITTFGGGKKNKMTEGSSLPPSLLPPPSLDHTLSLSLSLSGYVTSGFGILFFQRFLFLRSTFGGVFFFVFVLYDYT